MATNDPDRLSIAKPEESSGCWLWSGYPGGDLINAWVQGRKVFQLENRPPVACVHVTADTRYRLYVNGSRVIDGPARGFQEHWFYDTADIASYLCSGENVIAILAHNLGIGTHSYIHQGFAGFLLWGKLGEEPVATDSTWRVRPCPEHLRHLTRTSIQTGWQESVDARGSDGDWTATGYDDAHWPSMNVFGVRPAGCPPWHNLAARDVPLLREHLITEMRLHAVGTGANPAGWQTVANPLPCYVDSGVEWKEVGSVASADTADWIEPGDGETFRAWCFDLGREVLATTILEIENAIGTESIDLLMTEGCDGAVPAFRHEDGCRVQFAHRYSCRPGAQRYESFTPWGYRYLVVLVRRERSSALRVRLSLRHVEYPLEIRGGFRSSDDTLTRIYEMCAHTQQLCMSDAYLDCPGREQAMWWGDAHCHFENSIRLAADDRPFVRGLRLMARQTLPNGLTYAHAPTKAHECVLPDFTLMWIETHWQHWWYSGSPAMFIEHREKILAALDYFRARAEPTGLLSFDKRYWLFLDWAETFKEGVPTLYNVQYLRTLELAATMFALIDDRPNEEIVRGRAAALREKITTELWNASAGLPYDGIGWDGKHVSARTLHNRVAAIRANLWPEHHRRWIENDLLPFIQGIRPRGYSVNLGVTNHAPDRGAITPYFMQFVFEVLARAGHGAAVIDCIRRWWGDMLARGLVTTEEIWDAVPGVDSLCHAWTAHPIQFFSSLLLGVRPAAAGWHEVVYAPIFVGDFAAGTVDTPLGCIRSQWSRKTDLVELLLDLPPGCRAHLELPDGVPATATGNWRGTIRYVPPS